MKTFIAYFRVSTQEQGTSGLGIESQRQNVRAYVNSVDGTILEEFIDIESGKNNNRKKLWKAVERAKRTGSTLIVKKFDRLSRGGLEVMSLLEKYNIEYIESDSPNDDTLLKELKFSIAKDEVKKVSQRTSSALKVIKDKIQKGHAHTSKSGKPVTKLGNPENLTSESRLKSIKARRNKALSDPNNSKAAAMIIALRDEAGLSFYNISGKLNEGGFKTSKGSDFTDVQVGRLYKMFKESQDE